MQDLNVELKLERIRCHDEGDGPGSAEPYLWVVYFKVDGETLVVNSDGPNPAFLQGPPTVVPTPGNHGNLGVNDVDEGDEFPVPAIIGEYRTVMKPIPLTTPLAAITEVGGMVGCLVVLMEEDNTPASAIARGHEALDSAVRDRLAEFLGTLSISKQEPTDEDIAALSDQIGDAVQSAIGDGVSVLQWIGALGTMDAQVGSAVFRFSHSGLESSGGAPIPFSHRWDNEGDWELFGHIRATAIPRRDNCCDRLRKRIEKLEATTARQGTRIALLERAYLSNAADAVAREPVRRTRSKAHG